MLTEVMEHYGLERPFQAAGFFETDHHRQITKGIRTAIYGGRLVAVTGIVGCGKTMMLRRLQEDLVRENRVLVAKSLSVDKSRATLATLIAALFYDLSPDKEIQIAKQGERRERDLRDLIRKARKSVVLFVDEAHDLHSRTLVGLKRLMEVVVDGGGLLSIVLVGHPKLRNDLRRPTMEEIGYRSAMFSFEGIAGVQQDYLCWLLDVCSAADTAVEEIMAVEAIDLLAERLRTPLQIEQHLTLAFEEGYKIGQKPITADVIESVLSRQIDDLEPRLTRHGYDVKNLAEQFNVRPGEIKQFLAGQLDPAKIRDLTDRMLAAGLPL